jgi:hypothetical protein
MDDGAQDLNASNVVGLVACDERAGEGDEDETNRLEVIAKVSLSLEELKSEDHWNLAEEHYAFLSRLHLQCASRSLHHGGPLSFDAYRSRPVIRHN